MPKYRPTDAIVVIPAYNEGRVIQSVVKSVRELGYQVIAVDDGSKDNTLAEAEAGGAICVKHRLNRGKGAATKTGIEGAKLLKPRVIVTMDGDGQHSPNDIQTLIDPLLSNRCDVVLGTRPLIAGIMPRHRVIANHLGNFVTWAVHGLWVADSQSGFRAFSLTAAEVINTTSDRYEYESEVIREIRRHRLRYLEVPISVRYTQYDMTKQNRQNTLNGIKTVYKMLWDRIA